MFTGIIQTLGTVQTRKDRGGQVRLAIRPVRSERALCVGESIAVNGVCLTLAGKSRGRLEFDVVDQTLRATTLGKLRAGSRVNLERSLKMGDPIGGHFVSGHVDGVGEIRQIRCSRKNVLFAIEPPPPLMKFLAVKGSVAVDGVSMTIQSHRQKRHARCFVLALVPHTLAETTLGRKREGDRVNLEVDLVARYLHQLESEVPPRKRRKKKSPGLPLAELLRLGF